MTIVLNYTDAVEAILIAQRNRETVPYIQLTVHQNPHIEAQEQDGAEFKVANGNFDLDFEVVKVGDAYRLRSWHNGNANIAFWLKEEGKEGEHYTDNFFATLQAESYFNTLLQELFVEGNGDADTLLRLGFELADSAETAIVNEEEVENKEEVEEDKPAPKREELLQGDIITFGQGLVVEEFNVFDQSVRFVGFSDFIPLSALGEYSVQAGEERQKRDKQEEAERVVAEFLHNSGLLESITPEVLQRAYERAQEVEE